MCNNVIDSSLFIMMVFIDDSPVGNDEHDTATNTESQDNSVYTNGKENPYI